MNWLSTALNGASSANPLLGAASIGLSLFQKKDPNVARMQRYQLQGLGGISDTTNRYLKPLADQAYNPLIAKKANQSIAQVRSKTTRNQNNAKSFWGQRGNVGEANGDVNIAGQAGLESEAGINLNSAEAQYQDHRDNVNALLGGFQSLAGQGGNGVSSALQTADYNNQYDPLNTLGSGMGYLYQAMVNREMMNILKNQGKGGNG